MKTKYNVFYAAYPYGEIAVIPAGTKVLPADNLPSGGYWSCAWDGMSPEAESWHRNYGFLLNPEEVVNEDDV